MHVSMYFRWHYITLTAVFFLVTNIDVNVKYKKCFSSLILIKLLINSPGKVSFVEGLGVGLKQIEYLV